MAAKGSKGAGSAGGIATAISIALALLTVIAYAPVGELGFIGLDDRGYVTLNETVQAGLTLEGLGYAFTSNVLGNWHPLTWLSHMLTVELFGLDAAAHHYVNLALHLANTVLLFALLRTATGALWRSAVVAGLFAVHPLHVESVAWVAERKDVLSTLFWLLAMLAYVRYARSSSRRAYAAALLFMAFGLMSKAMLVTLPCVLFLFDFWPLRRIERPLDLRPVLLEKIPFFALAVAFSALTFAIQQSEGAVGSTESFPLVDRAANATLAYVIYLQKTVWPTGLTVFYPYPESFDAVAVTGAVLFLVVATVLSVRLARRWPYATVGWLWYAGTLVPVIGLIQVGNQAYADRYTYVPHIGFFVLATWAAWSWIERAGRPQLVAGVTAALALVACTVLTRSQTRVWRDDLTLFEHALRVTTDNYLAHDFLGRELRVRGEVDRAIEHYEEAVRIRPEYASAHNNLGAALRGKGDLQGARASFERAVALDPEFGSALSNLGAVCGQMGQNGEAVTHLRKAVQIAPEDPAAHANLATSYVQLRKYDEAARHFRRALAIRPDFQNAKRALRWLESNYPELRVGPEVKVGSGDETESP